MLSSQLGAKAKGLAVASKPGQHQVACQPGGPPTRGVAHAKEATSQQGVTAVSVKAGPQGKKGGATRCKFPCTHQLARMSPRVDGKEGGPATPNLEGQSTRGGGAARSQRSRYRGQTPRARSTLFPPAGDPLLVVRGAPTGWENKTGGARAEQGNCALRRESACPGRGRKKRPGQNRLRVMGVGRELCNAWAPWPQAQGGDGAMPHEARMREGGHAGGEKLSRIGGRERPLPTALPRGRVFVRHTASGVVAGQRASAIPKS